MDEPLTFFDLKVGAEFCWDHRKNMVDGWCAGLEHGLLRKRSATTYSHVDRPDDVWSIWPGAGSWKVRRDTNECGGVSLCKRCKDTLFFEVRRDLFKQVDHCDECKKLIAEEQEHAAVLAGEQRFLRRLVDVVWQTATESEAVPSTDWADRMIAEAKRLDATDPDHRDDHWRPDM